jgi:hypothetical protein
MMPPRVLFVYELPDVEPDIHQYANFLESLGHHLSHDVPLLQAALCEVKVAFDFVILQTLDVEQSLARCDASEQARLAQRLVLVYPRRRTGAFHAQMEKLCLAGALELDAMARWDPAESSNWPVEGLTGRRELATTVNATCMDDLMMPPIGYCFMVSTQHRGLPHLLADYLRALETKEHIQARVDE